MNLWFLKRRQLEFHLEDIFSRQNIHLAPKSVPALVSANFLAESDMWTLSSPTKDQTRTPCIGRQSLNTWTARKVPVPANS